MRQKKVMMLQRLSITTLWRFAYTALTMLLATGSAFMSKGYLGFSPNNSVATKPGRTSVKRIFSWRMFANCSNDCMYVFWNDFVAEYEGAMPRPLVPAMELIAAI